MAAVAGHIVAGKPSGLGIQHLFSRPGEWSLCEEAVWLEVQRADQVNELTWICVRCQAIAAGEPDPFDQPTAAEPSAPKMLADQVAAIRRQECPACGGGLTDPRRSAGGWRHCRSCRCGWAVETQQGRPRPARQDWPGTERAS